MPSAMLKHFDENVQTDPFRSGAHPKRNHNSPCVKAQVNDPLATWRHTRNLWFLCSATAFGARENV
ncbi:hypothetical protein ZHAS_00003095 [Anopheles sinensis]|uniref:Uncharacterized protein n=1 Tax=Anopheles sinensis TaxID=74873 RepID=A0A084VDM1_ANOSI|nr:hypothetical protein ZHAS_00003095 [Anopheles sinensis]